MILRPSVFLRTPTGPHRQRGITTLAITLILLVIITLMVIFSTNVGFYEQRTATNENRARISQKAAEYALSLAGEYLKANRDSLISNTGAGWLGATSPHWAKCADVSPYPDGHACLSEPDPLRRPLLYFWTTDGTESGSQSLPYTSLIPAIAQAEDGMGGDTADFDTTTNVRALLCRIDSSLAVPACRLVPAAGNRVAITLISEASLTNESGATASVKEIWGSYSTFTPSSAVPLMASGLVTGLGNGNIVANSAAASPSGTGSNIASMWSPNNINASGSYITCQISEFTSQLTGSEMSMADVKEDCPTNYGSPGSLCGCPKSPDETRTSKEDWSGHGSGGGGTFHKGHDVLDVALTSEPVCDSTVNSITANCRTLPSITFFPGVGSSGRMDDTGVHTDDSPFEYIFNVDYVVNFALNTDGTAGSNPNGWTMTNCGDLKNLNCVTYAMVEEFSAEEVGCTDPITEGGIYYIAAGCDDFGGTIGTPDSPAIVVINNTSKTKMTLANNTIIYGMLFVHSDKNNAQLAGQNVQVYGSLVVEGEIKMTGNNLIVYDDTSGSSNPNKFPKSARFGRVPGSWLDAKTSF